MVTTDLGYAKGGRNYAEALGFPLAFVEKRRAYLKAMHGTPEDMRRFRERYPDWNQFPPNRFASHFFMMENSELYRSASGQDLTSEDVDLELLGPKPGTKVK